MFQDGSRPFTSSSLRVSSALATGPVLSARAASATALMYCGTPNLPASPRPTTSTRGAATPDRSCNSAVLPVLPLMSPRSSSERRRPPLASSSDWPDGLSVLSAKTPTTTQSVATVAGAAGFRSNSRAIKQIPGGKEKELGQQQRPAKRHAVQPGVASTGPP